MSEQRIPQEVVEQAKGWSVYDYFETFHQGALQRHASEYRLREHPSFAVSSDGNAWCWHSQNLSGVGAISYLMKCENMTFTDAVMLLTGQSKSNFIKPIEQHKQVEFPFVLPERNDTNVDVIKYLKGRGLTENVINYCIEKGLLYQTKEYGYFVLVGYDEQNKPLYISKSTYEKLLNEDEIVDVQSYIKQHKLYATPTQMQRYNTLSNCVFVGYNEQKVPKYAFKRGLYNKEIVKDGKKKNQSYRQEVRGSNKEYSFLMSDETKTNKSVHLFEAAIDAMSYASLCELNNSNFRTKNLLSLGGVQSGKVDKFQDGKVTLPIALERFLQTTDGRISKVFIHFDNDEAGKTQAELLSENLTKRGIENEIRYPKLGKDVNDYLQIHQKKTNEISVKKAPKRVPQRGRGY